MAKNKGLRLVSKAVRENADKVVSFKAWQEFELIADSLEFNVAFQLSCFKDLPVLSEEQIDDVCVCSIEWGNSDQEE
jgi:hypothetical protein